MHWAPAGQIDVHSMKGRSRTYAVGDHHATAKISAFDRLHNRCDLIVATAAIGDDQPGAHEAPVLEFLNGEVVLALGRSDARALGRAGRKGPGFG